LDLAIPPPTPFSFFFLFSLPPSPANPDFGTKKNLLFPPPPFVFSFLGVSRFSFLGDDFFAGGWQGKKVIEPRGARLLSPFFFFSRVFYPAGVKFNLARARTVCDFFWFFGKREKAFPSLF